MNSRPVVIVRLFLQTAIAGVCLYWFVMLSR